MLKRRLISLLTILLLIGAVSNLYAQPKVKIKLTQPPPNKLGVGDMWNLELDNTTGKEIKIYLTGTAIEEKDGLIIEGKSKVFTLKPGKSNFKYNDFLSAEIKYNNGKYKEIILRTGNAPEGSYTICVTAFEENGEVAGQENCIIQNVQQMGSITLITPGDGEEVDITMPIMFSWTPLPKGGPYSLKIVEIKGEQSREVAIKQNRAFFEKEGVKTTTYQYPLSESKFEAGKKYAWQVKSGNIVSNTSYFMIITGDQCDNFSAIANQTTNCCGTITLSVNENTLGARKIQILPLDGNTFITGSSGISTSNWQTNILTGTEYRFKYNSGNIPNNTQLVFNVCLNKISSPQKVEVNWMDNSNKVLCKDTVQFNCDIPCATFSDISTNCTNNNLDVSFKITNNSTFTFSKFVVGEIITSSAVYNSSISEINLNNLSPGSTTLNPISLSFTNLTAGEEVCILLKFLSDNNCCVCTDTLCFVIPSCVCDKVDATISSSSNDCCFKLNINNQYLGNYFNNIKLTTLGNGVTFRSYSTDIVNNWSSNLIFPSSEIVLENDNGFIPLNLSQNILEFCLAGYQENQQKILIEWRIDGNTVCSDTLLTSCIPPPPASVCIQLLNKTITCNPDGTFTLKFDVANYSDFDANGFAFDEISPSNLVFDPNVFMTNIPNYPDAGYQAGPFELIIRNASPGQEICFQMAAFMGSVENNTRCCYSDTICITLPDCPTSNCNFDVKIDSITCGNKNPQGQQLYTIWSSVNNLTGVQAYIQGVYPSANISNSSSTMLNPGLNNFNFTYSGPQVNPLCFTFRIIRFDKPSDTCDFNICGNLPVCTTGDCCELKLESVYKGDTLCPGQNVKINWSGCSPTGMVTISLIDVTNNRVHQVLAVNVPANQQSYVWTIPSDIPCNPILKWHFYISDQQVRTCYTYGEDFYIKCCNEVKCDCKTEDGKLRINDKSYPFICGEAINEIAYVSDVISINPGLNCTNGKCLISTRWDVSGPNGFSNSGSNFPITFTPSEAGFYYISSYIVCGTDTCRCVSKIEVKKKETGCDCKKGRWGLDKSRISYEIDKLKKDDPIKCEGKYTVNINSSVTLNPQYICPKECRTASYSYRINGGTMTSPQTTPFVLTNISNTTDVMIYAWCGKTICDSCRITIIPKESPKCDCGGWINMKYSINEVREKNINCSDTILLKEPSSITFNYSYLCIPKNCKPTIKWEVVGPVPGNGPGNNGFSYNFSQPGTYNVILNAECDEKSCPPCTLTVKVSGKPTGCKCITPDLQYIKIDIPNSNEILTLPCDYSTITHFLHGGVFTITPPPVTCQGIGCNVIYSWFINNQIVTGENNQSITRYFGFGNYNIERRATCSGMSGLVCLSCRFSFGIIRRLQPGRLGGIPLGDISIVKANVSPTIFNPNSSLRPDFTWENSGSPNKQKYFRIVEIIPREGTTTLSDMEKDLTGNEPHFEINAESNFLSYPKEIPDLKLGSIYLWVVYELGDNEETASLLDVGLFQAGSNTVPQRLGGMCEECQKECKNGRCFEFPAGCLCIERLPTDKPEKK